MSLFKAYVLYLFLSLMLSYLECEINDTEVVAYLESQPPQYLPCPFNYCFPGEIPRGREFLRYCKFGTLQVSLTSSNPIFITHILPFDCSIASSDQRQRSSQ